MWSYWIIGGAVLVSLVGLSAIVVGKFPQLSLIDVDALPQEREAQKKKAIIRDRVGRRMAKRSRWLKVKLTPAFRFVVERAQLAHEKLSRLDKKFWERTGRFIHPVERRKRAAKLVTTAEQLLDQEKIGEAEKKLVEAISLDRQHWAAYRGLGELYMGTKNYAQAKETYQYLVRANSRQCCGKGRRRQAHIGSPAVQAAIAKDNLCLALACKAAGDVAGWREAAEAALLHEKANPRHLDILLEACIMDGDRKRAEQIFALLKEANPDNQKLDQLAEKIASLNGQPEAVKQT